MASSGFVLAGLYILVVASQSWAAVKVNMEDRVEVSLGQRAEISCLHEMDSDPSTAIIQWFAKAPGPNSARQHIYFMENSVRIPEPDSPFTGRITVEDRSPGSVVLILDPVQLQDELLFICQVDGKTEGKEEGSTYLRVFSSPEMPRIKKADSGILINEKDPSKIASCEVRNGYPLPNITWYRDRTPLQISEGEVGVVNLVTRDTNSLYTVRSDLHLKVRKEDKDAVFYCESSYFVPDGMAMTESIRINITVHYPPTYVELSLVTPTDLVKEGDDVEIRCYADGNPSPPLTLKHNGEDVDEQMLTANQEGVLLRNAKRSDGGTYSCTALDLDALDPDSGELENSLELPVHYLDHAVVLPEDLMVLSQGAILEATCNAVSSLKTHTVWYKDGRDVSEGHVLKLVNVSLDTSGEYRCVVTTPDLAGLRTEGSLQVLVQGQPQITDVTQEDDELSVNLTCVVLGYPTPSVTWGSSGQEDLNGLSRDTPILGGVISTLTVKATSALSFVCEAENTFGKDSRTVMVESMKPETTPAPATSLAPETNLTAVPGTKPSGSVTVKPPRRVQKEGSGVIIAVLIVCVLLLAILGSVLYFLYKKGKIPCGRSGKQDLTKEKSNKDAIVMEMKTDKSDEAVLLQGVNGDKKAP
ncbi:melanoma cell adhesion molecule b isoform X2 [Clupea harengus]|uniref:Melanoma cell adhesion molecule b isoform X2 n=1 Tax=Clupea harengus TaxID=7950 RepID=A0A6P3WFK8_CLUHA|nr:melanoma cell adhesion molecule b isoform X2 [Clupea harengus]